MQESRPLFSVLQTQRLHDSRCDMRPSQLSQLDPYNVYATLRQIVVIHPVPKKTLHVRWSPEPGTVRSVDTSSQDVGTIHQFSNYQTSFQTGAYLLSVGFLT